MNCKRINVGICDSSRENCAYIADIIKKCFGYGESDAPELWIDCFYSGKAFMEAMETVKYDIAFIDVNKSDTERMRIGRYIREFKNWNQMQIIYMSASYFYTMELFEIRPLHVLLKPIEEKSLIRTVCRAINLVRQNKGYFYYVRNRMTEREEVSNILYFESMNRQLLMHTVSGNMLFYGRLKDVYDKLKKEGFFYVHQSFLVNYKYIKKFDKGQEILLKNGERIQVSHSRRNEVIQMFQEEYIRSDYK